MEEVLDQANLRDLRAIVAERTSSVICWIGAGLSRPAGIPGWGELRDFLVECTRKKAGQLPVGGDRESALRAADFAESTTDLWHAFSTLKKALGKTSYRKAIREKLAASSDTKIPQAYKDIWAFSDGVVSVNVDGLAKNAYAHSRRSDCAEFSAFDARRYAHILQGPSPFVINVHGKHDDPHSWVFTTEELANLWRNEIYRDLVKSLLLSRIVVFVGISAADPSISDHFKHFAEWDVELGRHYWITHLSDAGIHGIAEELGLRIIQYQSSGGDHSQLSEILSELAKAQPGPDVSPAPIEPASLADGRFVQRFGPDEMALKPPHEIRVLLNSYANEIFRESPEPYAAYKTFCARFRRAIHNSYYIDTAEPDNKFMKYVVTKKLDHEGAFGNVYRAVSPEGKPVAIKLLKKDVFERPGWIESFRRGAHSMQILTRNNVPHVVRLVEAYEIPTAVVMEFVDGITLTEAVEASQLKGWPRALKVSRDIIEPIMLSHELEERVFHRDIRPPNIMLRDFYDQDDIDVVILDFDLSWHRHAVEDSIHISSTPHGYLAPEQMSGKVSARHAGVDVFGLGMTLFSSLLAAVLHQTNNLVRTG